MLFGFAICAPSSPAEFLRPRFGAAARGSAFFGSERFFGLAACSAAAPAPPAPAAPSEPEACAAAAKAWSAWKLAGDIVSRPPKLKLPMLKLPMDGSDDAMDALLQEQASLQDQIEAADAWELDHRVERAMDALRVTLREGRYCIGDEEEALRLRAEEKQRRLARGLRNKEQDEAKQKSRKNVEAKDNDNADAAKPEAE